MDQDQFNRPETPSGPVRVETATVQPKPVSSAMRPASKGPPGGRIVNLALGVAFVAAVGGTAFAVGRGTAPAQVAAVPGGFGGNGPNGSFVPGFGGGRGQALVGAGGVTLEGTVLSVDADSMELQTANGQTIEVALGADTEYHTQANTTAGDVAAGSAVIVRLETDAFNSGARPNRSGVSGLGPTAASDVTIVP